VNAFKFLSGFIVMCQTAGQLGTVIKPR